MCPESPSEKAQRYFDITRECFRASLLDLGDRRYVLLLVFDHIVSDAASREIFFSDLVDCYIALSEGRSPNLPKPNVSYLDYAYWERNCPTGPALAEGLAFWKNYLAGSQPLSRKLTTDHPRAVLDAKRREQPLGASFPAGRVAWSVPPDLLPALRTLASRRNTTLFTVLYTVITCLLHRYTRMADITICSLNDMRSHVAELARVIGPCGNRVLLRLDVSGNPTFRQLLSRAHTEVFRLLSRPSFPLLPVYYPTFNDMFRVELNVTRAARPADWPGFHVTPIPVSQIEPYMKSPTTHMDIVFNVDVAAGRVITGSILYNAELWEPQRITNVASDLIEVLHRIAAQPDIRVRALPASAFDPPGSS